MSNYTPGPWEWDSDDNDLVIRPRRITEDNEVSVIAVLPLESYEYLEDWSECSWSAEGEANARLISAAPEMYELLKKFVDKADVRMPGHDVFDADGKLISWVSQRWVDNELLDKTNALMRRVEGEDAGNEQSTSWAY